MTAGDRLRELRRARGLAQLGVAVRAGCSPSTVVAIERHAHTPQPATRQRIAAALGVDVAAIWDGSDAGTEDACRARA